MEVKKITPRGYCYGVVDAMVMARHAAQNPDLPRPIYILGMLVHNQHVVDAFADEGIITLDGKDRLSLLEDITTGTVIFTAHGVSSEVKNRAIQKGLTVLDATCPDVTKTHDLIRDKVNQGYGIIYIGKRNHPEPEGAIGVAPNHVHLVECEEDILQLNLKEEKVLATNQTTMSQWDTIALMNLIKDKYPTVEIHNEICLATQERQEAVVAQAEGVDLVIVVGDPRSNNSKRLAQVSKDVAGVDAYRIAHLGELDINILRGKKTVGVTAGASTPSPLTREVIQFLEQFEESDPSTWEIIRTVNPNKILPPVRTKSV